MVETKLVTTCRASEILQTKDFTVAFQGRWTFSPLNIQSLAPLRTFHPMPSYHCPSILSSTYHTLGQRFTLLNSITSIIHHLIP